MRTRVHLNNAGAALPPRPVSLAVEGHLRLESQIGGYEAAEARAAAVEETYRDVASVIGAAPGNVAITQSATASFAQALSAFDLEPGDRILTTRNDYASNQIMYLSLARRRGVRVERADDLKEGGVDPGSVRERIARERPRLVAVTWVPTSSGLVQPVEAVGEICKAAGVPYLVDACQAVGQIPVDAPALGCDFLAATARKFLRGPRGVGFLYVSDSALASGAHPLLPDMRGATWTDADAYVLAEGARRFEMWEFADALRLGLGAAARYALAVGIERGGERARALAVLVRRRLEAVPGVRVLDRGSELCAIVTAEVRGWSGREVVLALRKRGINTSVIDRESAVIDMDEKGFSSGVRVSPHYFNTEAETGSLVEAVAELVAGRAGRYGP